MPGKTDLAQLNCSLARALGQVGDWWTLLIIRDALLGVRRFSDFSRSLGVARNILAARLEGLVAADILERRGTMRRPLYELTAKGRELLPAIVALTQWGDAWASGGVAPVAMLDPAGQPIAPVGLRSRAGQPLANDSVKFVAGPGATADTRAFLERL
jgi:DNA-binding HxlR family transcriptional regulator